MYIDSQLALSDEQAVTATAASTNYLDLGASNRDVGLIDDLYILFTVNTTTVSAGATTMTVKIQTDDDSAFGSATTLFTSEALAKATLVAGYQKPFKIPVAVGTPERYLRLYYTVSTADFSAGAFSAHVIYGIQKWTALADAL